VVLALRGAVARRGQVTLGPVDLTIGPATRLRITGPNGAGKTTLLDALLGRLPLLAGEQYAGPGTAVGELDQSRRTFATDTPVADVVAAATGLPADETRTLLAKFRLRGDIALRPARALSPASGPGPPWPCSRPAASTAWSWTSRPTTWTSRPSSSSSRPWTATAAR
jgi:ATPase subunit of ABC transporter with duplicated ATPase domains